MGSIASQITSLTIVYSTVYSDAVQRKHQSPASLAFVRGIHRRPVRSPVNSPHKWPVTRKMFPFDNVIMNFKVALRWSCDIFLALKNESRQRSLSCSDNLRRLPVMTTLASRQLLVFSYGVEWSNCYIMGLSIWFYSGDSWRRSSVFPPKWPSWPRGRFPWIRPTSGWSRPHQGNSLQRRLNERDSVSNHQPHDCLFRRRSNKTSKLRVTALCAGNAQVTGEFPAQMASNAENMSIIYDVIMVNPLVFIIFIFFFCYWWLRVFEVITYFVYVSTKATPVRWRDAGFSQNVHPACNKK